MSLGIGLGSFLGGVAQGYNMGSGIRDDFTKRKKQKAIDDVDATAKQDFAGIKATDPSANWNTFYSDTVVPRKIQTLQEQGDMEGADRYQKWSDSEAAKRGGKLFAGAMIKGQNGDIGGALDDMIEAGKVKGYINHDWSITGKEPIKDFDGKVTGYKVMVQGADGKAHEQIFNSTDEVLQFGATFANPDAAFDTWQAGRQQQAKTQQDIQSERNKLGLKREDDMERKRLGLNKGAEDPGKVYDEAVKILSAGADWDTLSKEDQQGRIQTYINDRAAVIAAQGGGAAGGGEPAAPGLGPAAAGGKPARSGRRMIVDQNTGEAVPEPAAEAPAPAAAAPQASAAPGIAPEKPGFWSTVGANLASGPSGAKQDPFTGEQTSAGAPPPAAQPQRPVAAPSVARGSAVDVAKQSPEVLGIGAAQPSQRPGPEFSGLGMAQPLPNGQQKPAAQPAGGAAAEPGTMPIRDPELESLRQQLPAAAQRVLDAAARAIRNGVDEKILIPQLQSAGIPSELWPF